MAKQRLGRDLGALMGRDPKQQDAPAGAGVRSLMRGQNPPPPPAPKPLIPRWYLFAGDVLLAALALATVCKSPHPLSWPRALFCVALVVLAAALGVIALLMPDGRAANPPKA